MSACLYGRVRSISGELGDDHADTDRFVFGYDTGEISGLVAMPDFISRFAEPDGFSDNREGLIVALLSIGALLGSATAGWFADRPKIGRRGLIMIACWVFIIGTIIQIASVTSWVQLMIGRFVAGIAVGQLSAIVPVYQSETAPKSIRGTLTATYQCRNFVYSRSKPSC